MIISSLLDPKVVITNAWVSPRVKSAEPCVLGKISTSIDIGRISAVDRPSLLFPVARICSRNPALKRSSIRDLIVLPSDG